MFDPVSFAASSVASPMISNWLTPDPSKKAMKYLDQIPGTIKPYYEPYINAGKNQLPQMQQLFSQLMSDPSSIIAKMGQGYKESPGFQFRLNQGQNAIGNANAAGGTAGTMQHMQQSGQMAEDMAGEDYNKYMDQVMKMFGLGTSGGMDITKMGQESSQDLATSLANTLMSQSNLKYGGQASKNKETGGLFNSLYSIFSDKDE